MRAKVVLFSILVVAAAACGPIFFWDLRVTWKIDGSDSQSLCSTYNIGEFDVYVSGPESRVRSFPCAAAWDSDTRFFSIEEGFYSVRIKVKEKGTGKILAERSETVHVLDDEIAPEPDRAEIAFRSTDFTGGSTQPRINFYWNINNTVDGTAKGKSWDTCAEVGASKAVLTIQPITSSGANDGPAQTASRDCHAGGNMSAALNVAPGDYKVSVKLVDSAGADLTTATQINAPEAKLTSITSSKPGEFVADFYWYSFKQGKADSITGTYYFNLTFGDNKQSCGGTNPPVSGVAMSLSRLTSVPAGTYSAVTAQVCTEAGKCFSSNGSDAGVCQDKTKKYDVKKVKWGLYKGTLSGTATNLEVCWKQSTFSDSKVDGFGSLLLVGAGDANPVRAINVAKDKSNTSKTCNP